MRLKDKVAIITGAGSGIGKASAERFIKEGAKVVLADINEEAITVLRKQLGPDVIAIQTDVSNPAAVQNLVNLTIDRFEKIDILFSNAGIEYPATVLDIEPDEWDHVISVNLKSVYLCAKYVLPHMIDRGGGAIVNTASQLGLVGYPNFAVYNAAKGGVINLTRNLALDYAKHNIRVNAVCPGPIDTPHIERQVEGLPDDEKQKVYKDISNLVPLGRLGKAEEIANGVLFLASDEASFVTGTTFVIDGGYVAQ
ncbi:SDR family NAD(P)-dependent oxidoreductase [Fredinandcohnia sp. FSL W7-1320]|uniref:SDR family NAD(P)-dependent oxidoreductase n=1 Tax=Fredinandcohnia sp. FSL W7-1320 TaxID=2954540 RepID=UPI0030FD67C6